MLLIAWRQFLPFLCLLFYFFATVLFFLLLFRIGCAESSTLNRLLSSRGDLGRPVFAVHRPLVASLAELGLEGVWASVVQ